MIKQYILAVKHVQKKKQTKESLKDKFPTTYQLTNDIIDKFIFLLKRGVYPYEYMDRWKRFNEIELPSKDKFYSYLYVKDISKDDYKHPQRVWSLFKY